VFDRYSDCRGDIAELGVSVLESDCVDGVLLWVRVGCVCACEGIGRRMEASEFLLKGSRVYLMFSLACI